MTLNQFILVVSSHLMRTAYLRSSKLFPVVDLRLLVLEVLYLGEHATLLGVVGVGGLGGPLLRKLGGLILWSELKGAAISCARQQAYSPTDAVDELGQGLRVLTGDSLDVSLENQEVLGLHEDVELLELRVVGLI